MSPTRYAPFALRRETSTTAGGSSFRSGITIPCCGSTRPIGRTFRSTGISRAGRSKACAAAERTSTSACGSRTCLKKRGYRFRRCVPICASCTAPTRSVMRFSNRRCASCCRQSSAVASPTRTTSKSTRLPNAWNVRRSRQAATSSCRFKSAPGRGARRTAQYCATMKRDLRVHSVPTRAEQVRTAVEIVAILAAGIWALYTFVYEQRIKPLSEPAEFSLPTTVTQGPTVNGVAFLTIHKRLENTGNVPIDVAAEALSVYGEKLVNSSAHVERTETPVLARVRADVPREPVALLFSTAKLRIGAVGGNPKTAFFLPPHSAAEQVYLVAVSAHLYPVVLVTRMDVIRKAPIDPKVPVHIVRTRLGAYTLAPTAINGEYDSEDEFPIKP